MTPHAHPKLTALLVAGMVTGVPLAGAAQSVIVRSLSIEGNASVSDGQLRAAMITRASGRFFWSEKHDFNQRTFEADLSRIVAYYRDRGYHEARVRSTDVDVSPDGRSVDLRVWIDEGAPTIVERVDYESFDVLSDLDKLRRAMPIQSGAPLDAVAVRRTRQLMIDAMRDHGYPRADARVDIREAATRRQIITLTGIPGEAARYGPIEIDGLSTVGEHVVRRQLTYRPGELFRISDLRESQRGLYGLELFKFVNVTEAPQAPGAEIPTRVTVVEGDHRRVNLSAGFGSEERLRGEADWRHVNFLGSARTAGVTGRWSSLTRGVRVRLHQPYFFTPRLSSEVSGAWWYDDEPAYVMETYGGRATLTHVVSRRPPGGDTVETKLVAGYTHEFSHYTVTEDALNDPESRDDLIALGLNPDTGKGSGLLSSISLAFNRTSTDNPLDPHRGLDISLRLEHAGGWLGGDFQFLETAAEARVYYPITSRAVVALRGRVGAFAGPEPIDQKVPFFKRYFLGGATSLRGWGRFEVGPTSEGVTLGGISALETAAELRVTLRRRLGVVGFVDAGNAWDREWRFLLGDLRADAGAGLRVLTPVGPFRFDYAYQLTPIPGLIVDGEPETRTWRVHFSVGQAF